MKKLPILLFLVVPLLLVSQRRPKIKGNRSVTEVNEELPPFSAIELKDNLNIELKKSFGEGYEIVADDNLVDVLKFEVVDSTLVVSSFYDIVSKKKLEIAINYRELNGITVKEGKVFSETSISSDALYLNVFGNAELDIDANGFLANVNTEDNAKIDLNLDIDSLNVNMKHKSDGIIYAVSGAKEINLQDNTSLTLEGTTETLVAKLYGNAKLKAQALEAAEVTLLANESVFARVNAFRNFKLTSNGSSKTHLYGNPKITIEDFLDTSQLLKKQD